MTPALSCYGYENAYKQRDLDEDHLKRIKYILPQIDDAAFVIT